MRQLTITDADFERLQRWAIPLVDTELTALRRVLDAAEAHLRCDPGFIERRKAAGPLGVDGYARASRPRRGTKRERTVHVLIREGIVNSGTRLILHKGRFTRVPRIDFQAPDYRCHFAQNPRAKKNVIWERDGRAYSLSELTEKLRERYPDLPFPPGGELNGYAWWSLASMPGKSLWELAEELVLRDRHALG